MDFYRVQPYNIILLQYNGDGNFNIEIFNHEAVEIDYPLRPVAVKKPRLTEEMSNIEPRVYSTVEVDKMWSRFYYNALSNSGVSCNLLIQKRYLKLSNKLEVMFVIVIFCWNVRF